MTTYLANLDFDDRLGGKAGGSQPRPGPPDENAVLWRVVAEEGDEILVPGLADQFESPAVGSFPAVVFRPPKMNGEKAFIPWGADDLARRLSQGRITKEDVELVKRLNDRHFAFDVARTLSNDTNKHPLLSHTVFVTEPSEVLTRAAAGELLMLKPRHGGFGRGLRRILGPDSNPNLTGWVHARCREGGLIAEPLLTSIRAEWALHWQLDEPHNSCTPQGDFLGSTTLHCEARGQFQQSDSQVSTSIEDTLDSSLPDVIRNSSYRGPLSIDVCQYEWDGQRFVGTLRDINARWTVGRLALQAARMHRSRIRIGRVSHSDKLEQRSSNHVFIPPLNKTNRPRWSVTFGE